MTESNSNAWWQRILGVAVLYWVAVFIATHLPGDVLPGEGPPDKLMHFVAYAGLAYLLGWSEVLRCGSSVGVYLRVLAVILLYAAFDEWSQTLVRGRYADALDWVADACGTAMGVMAVGATAVLRQKRLEA